MKKGMVLEGGAKRGLYSAGELDVLMEKGVDVDGSLGVSAGVTFGCNYKSRQIGRTLRYNLRFIHDPRYCSLRSLIRTGDIFGARFCYHDIPEKLDPFDYETFASNPVRLYTVATDAYTGSPVYKELKDGGSTDLEWMRASASMPVVSKAVQVDGYTLFDGGVSDSIPIDYLMSLGYERNLVVLTRPRGYRKDEGPLNPLMRIAMRKYPKLLERMEARGREYNSTLDHLDSLEKEGVVLIIAPSKDLHVKRLEKDTEKLRAIYELGRSDTTAELEKIRAFFS